MWVTPPLTKGEEGEAPAQVKQRLRESLLAFRAEQLADPAVRAFLKRMEDAAHLRGAPRLRARSRRRRPRAFGRARRDRHAPSLRAPSGARPRHPPERGARHGGGEVRGDGSLAPGRLAVLPPHVVAGVPADPRPHALLPDPERGAAQSPAHGDRVPHERPAPDHGARSMARLDDGLPARPPRGGPLVVGSRARCAPPDGPGRASPHPDGRLAEARGEGRRRRARGSPRHPRQGRRARADRRAREARGARAPLTYYLCLLRQICGRVRARGDGQAHETARSGWCRTSGTRRLFWSPISLSC